LEAFAAEDIDAIMEVFTDLLKWTGPDKKCMIEFDLKDDLKQALVSYTTLYEIHKLEDAVYFGGKTYNTSGETSNCPNAVRVYLN
tara:strand:+ start:313 stop:567 length:255 start_codon:yes stop_codon:yes gene_type:complete